MKYLALINTLLLAAFLCSCSSTKSISSKKSKKKHNTSRPEYTNNKITTIGDVQNMSTGGNTKVIFNGSNNELIVEYFDSFFNSTNSRNVIIFDGNGNTLKIQNRSVIDNSVNRCDTLIIKGNDNYIALLNEYFIDNSANSSSTNEIEEDFAFTIVENSNKAFVKDTSNTLNKINNEWMKVHEVFDYYLKSAMTGNASASFYIGEMYQIGVGTAIDIKKAEYYYTIAANQNYSEAQSILGYIYEHNYESIPADKEKSMYWYEKAAQNGDEYAIERLAELKGN